MTVQEYYESMGVVHKPGKCPLCTTIERQTK